MTDNRRFLPAATSLAAAAAAALMAGCSFIPTYERPAAPVATASPAPRRRRARRAARRAARRPTSAGVISSSIRACSPSSRWR
jgi:hypothetical protein